MTRAAQNKPATRHTPGPWSIRRLTSGWPVITSEAHDVADLRLNGKGLAHVEANAALLAAGPDLLEALDYLLQQTVDQDLKYGICLSEGEEEARAKALAAIAKATAIPNQTIERSQP
jgi:hypothetical protein